MAVNAGELDRLRMDGFDAFMALHTGGIRRYCLLRSLGYPTQGHGGEIKIAKEGQGTYKNPGQKQSRPK